MYPVKIVDIERWVTRGIIDDQAISLYTEGACWYLAYLLHKRTALPMAFVGEYGYWSDGTRFGQVYDFGWHHVGLMIAPDKFLDILGVVSFEHAKNMWSWSDDTKAIETVEFGAPDSEYAKRMPYYWPIEVDMMAEDVTEGFVSLLLERYGSERMSVKEDSISG